MSDGAPGSGDDRAEVPPDLGGPVAAAVVAGGLAWFVAGAGRLGGGSSALLGACVAAAVFLAARASALRAAREASGQGGGRGDGDPLGGG